MWLFNKQGHSPHMHNVCMHEAAYAPVTVIESEIPHCVSKFCWLPSESPLLRGYSIFSGETWSVLDKWKKNPTNMQGVFCWRIRVKDVWFVLMFTSLYTRSPPCISLRFVARRRQPFLLPNDQFLMTSIKCLWHLYLGLGAVALHLNCDYPFRWMASLMISRSHHTNERMRDSSWDALRLQP